MKKVVLAVGILLSLSTQSFGLSAVSPNSGIMGMATPRNGFSLAAQIVLCGALLPICIFEKSNEELLLTPESLEATLRADYGASPEEASEYVRQYRSSLNKVKFQ